MPNPFDEELLPRLIVRLHVQPITGAALNLVQNIRDSVRQ
jgi:hypothetical protein